MTPIYLAPLLLLMLVPLQAGAQEFSLAPEASQKSVRIDIAADGSAHVTHVVRGSGEPVQLGLVAGGAENIAAYSGDSKVQHATSGGSSVVLFPSRDDVSVEYDLPGALAVENGMWTWDYRYLASSDFYFPDGIDMIFSNGKMIMLDDKKGIRCHGCQMRLEFFDAEPEIKRVSWEGRQFDVPVITAATTGPLYLDQPAKTASMGVGEPDRHVVIVMPLELLWEPYEVYVGDERIIAHTDGRNSTHVWISARPGAGTMSIIGTTVVPEFSLFAPLAAGLAAAAALRYRASRLWIRTSKTHTRLSSSRTAGTTRHTPPPTAPCRTGGSGRQSPRV